MSVTIYELFLIFFLGWNFKFVNTVVLLSYKGIYSPYSELKNFLPLDISSYVTITFFLWIAVVLIAD